jgi:pimeloyl-ACP methyl ester carboxylesterase
VKTERLQVPGASLYYEVRGSGLVLLMIPGGPDDAGGFKGIADRLADTYTVVTYDCRGNSRSPMQGSWDDLTVALFADDAHRLLDAVSTDQADVLGSSGGATYALDLVARYPGRVRTLVAHEPPVSELLPDAARYHALNEHVGETYRSGGTFAALEMFTKGIGFGNDDPPERTEQTPEDAAAEARVGANLGLFAGRLIPIIGNYEPDLAALRENPTRIVVGVGDESTPEQMVYQTAHELAERLGSQPAHFPGGHSVQQPSRRVRRQAPLSAGRRRHVGWVASSRPVEHRGSERRSRRRNACLWPGCTGRVSCGSPRSRCPCPGPGPAWSGSARLGSAARICTGGVRQGSGMRCLTVRLSSGTRARGPSRTAQGAASGWRSTPRFPAERAATVWTATATCAPGSCLPGTAVRTE